MNPGWETTVHKDYPALLNGKISKRFRTENARASKSGDFELQDLIQTSLKATSQIAEIMTEAYSIRLTADYQPNVSVLFSDDQSFSLNDIDINQAQEWYATLNTLLPTLQSAWKQIDA